MSKRAGFTGALTARAPRALDRRGRVELVDEAARALIAEGSEAGLFTGGALLAWLERGGNLERDYLRVTKPKSHRTPTAIWRELQAGPHPDERQAEGSQPSSAPSSSKSGQGK